MQPQAPSSDDETADALREPVLESLQAFVSGRQRVLNISLDEIQQRLVHLALERSGGNITAAAQMLGMSRAQVSYRLKGS